MENLDINAVCNLVDSWISHHSWNILVPAIMHIVFIASPIAKTSRNEEVLMYSLLMDSTIGNVNNGKRCAFLVMLDLVLALTTTMQ